MLIATGSAVEVKAAVSGPIGGFMPADIHAVFESVPSGIHTWQPDVANNTLTDLIAGNIYYAVSIADVQVPAFVSPSDDSQGNSFTLIFNAESTDNDAGDLPAVNLVNNSVNVIRALIAATNTDNSYKSAAEVLATISVDGSGTVTIDDATIVYLFGNLDFYFDVDTNKAIPQVTNTFPAFTGTTKWRVRLELEQVIYFVAP